MVLTEPVLKIIEQTNITVNERLCSFTGSFLASIAHMITSWMRGTLRAITAVSMSTPRGLLFVLTLNLSQS